VLIKLAANQAVWLEWWPGWAGQACWAGWVGWSGWAGWAGLAGLAGLPGPTSKIINNLGSKRALEQKEREHFRNIKKVLFRTLLMFLKK